MKGFFSERVLLWPWLRFRNVTRLLPWTLTVVEKKQIEKNFVGDQSQTAVVLPAASTWRWPSCPPTRPYSLGGQRPPSTEGRWKSSTSLNMPSKDLTHYIHPKKIDWCLRLKRYRLMRFYEKGPFLVTRGHPIWSPPYRDTFVTPMSSPTLCTRPRPSNLNLNTSI